MDLLWATLDSIQASTKMTKLVANSKTLHHILPGLMPPIDRAFTVKFFYGSDVLQTAGDRRVFYAVFPWFHEIGQRQSQLIKSCVGRSKYHTSESKVIDNAIVGFLKSAANEESGVSMER